MHKKSNEYNNFCKLLGFIKYMHLHSANKHVKSKFKKRNWMVHAKQLKKTQSFFFFFFIPFFFFYVFKLSLLRSDFNCVLYSYEGIWSFVVCYSKFEHWKSFHVLFEKHAHNHKYSEKEKVKLFVLWKQ